MNDERPTEIARPDRDPDPKVIDRLYNAIVADFESRGEAWTTDTSGDTLAQAAAVVAEREVRAIVAAARAGEEHYRTLHQNDLHDLGEMQDEIAAARADERKQALIDAADAMENPYQCALGHGPKSLFVRWLRDRAYSPVPTGEA